MPTLRRSVLILMCVATLLGVLACSGGSKKQATTATPKPIPSPVAIAQEPHDGFTLGDPSFLEALPDTTVETGRLGGTVYQIEKPNNWNGRLVMYIHGNESSTELQAFPPPNRAYLIEHRYAWATSSFSVNVIIVSGLAADETAALWDYFAQKNGRPAYTYVEGISMGGSSVLTSAERYADRYDGALALCGDAPPGQHYLYDLFVFAAYAAGVTQEEFDSTDLGELSNNKILPALRDPAKRKVFEDVWIDQTGGPRPFAREGLEYDFSTQWPTFLGNVAGRYFGNDTKVYKLGPSAGVSSDEFNQKAVRFKKERSTEYDAGNALSGDIKIPTITMQSTGDVATAFDETQEVRRRADRAGKGDLLVQRAIRDPRHCGDNGFTLPEIDAGLEDLAAWVEQGKKPAGEDLLGDLTNAGKRFTLSPRLGDDTANDVPGADRRVTVHGVATLDGQPIDGSPIVWAFVRKDGFLRGCSFLPDRPIGGAYHLTLASDAEAPGCGAAGQTVYIMAFKDGQVYVGDQSLDWPSSNDAQFDASFSSAEPTGAAPERTIQDFFGTGFFGSAFDRGGDPLPPGTKIEAYIGTVLCGTFTIAPTVMQFDEAPGTYALSIPSPATKPECGWGRQVTFKINGMTAPQTGLHDVGQQGHFLILTAR